MKPLSEKQLKVLLTTPDEDLRRAFPRYSRSFLRAEKSRAQEMFPPDLRASIEAERVHERARLREVDRLYQASVHEVERLRKQLDATLAFPKIHPRDVTITGKRGEREAVAVALASDWHCEEEVTLESTNGANEYNLEVFDYRSRWFFANLIKLLNKEAQAVNINTLILGVLGDMFSGAIHADIRTLLGPTQACALAGDTIAGGIHKILKETPKSFRIIVPIKWGNHSRTTDDQRIASEADFSLEWLMAHHLIREFRDEPRVTIVAEQSLLTYVQAFDHTLRFLHGHCIGYQGGVGGITIPVNKAIAQWDVQRKAHATFFGHFHQYLPGARFLGNGSMIGYSPFATWVKAAYERPVQAFCLIDSRHGRTVQAPILLEDA